MLLRRLGRTARAVPIITMGTVIIIAMVTTTVTPTHITRTTIANFGCGVLTASALRAVRIETAPKLFRKRISGVRADLTFKA